MSNRPRTSNLRGRSNPRRPFDGLGPFHDRERSTSRTRAALAVTFLSVGVVGLAVSPGGALGRLDRSAVPATMSGRGIETAQVLAAVPNRSALDSALANLLAPSGQPQPPGLRSSSTPPSSTPPTSQPAPPATSAQEEEFLSLANGERRTRGLRLLTADASLQGYARRHAAEMRAQNRLFHDMDGLGAAAPPGWRKLGENVGRGRSVRAIHDAFMRSSGHRANVLDPQFSRTGIGVVQRSSGEIFVSVEFLG